MNLLSLLTGSLTNSQSVNTVSEKTGLGDAKVRYLLSLAIPLLIKFLTKNASSNSGATSLLSALTQHKSTRAVAEQISEADTDDGAKIIGHILGDEQESTVRSLANDSGLSTAQVSSVLSMIAPALLSGVSAATTSANTQAQAGVDLSDGLDFSDLMGLFGAVTQTTQPAQTNANTNGNALLSILSGLMK